MRKHLLSIYAERKSMEVNSSIIASLCKKSYETSGIENSSSDEVLLKGPTNITRSVEDSDIDEFLMKEPTRLTYTVENNDLDEFMLGGPTALTEDMENSDPDEFFSCNKIDYIGVENGDYDTFL